MSTRTLSSKPVTTGFCHSGVEGILHDWPRLQHAAAKHDIGDIEKRGGHFVAPEAQFEDCLAAALASPVKPYFISDSGDNPGAGGADDCTFTLDALLKNEEVINGSKRVVQVSNVDPAAVEKGSRGWHRERS
ncbi:MlrC C-terminal domain-containing protein [Corynebacterium aquilae]|uniref:MlrC C-terminal domain-containing protein n=1 Tax=Corynebacterium aquilae TaxID=203263 RepID=UPI001473D16E|nr:MlrC C-terminal domain-containing protein [Corynebacterium aquilae]